MHGRLVMDMSCDDLHRSNIETKMPIAIAPVSEVIGDRKW